VPSLDGTLSLAEMNTVTVFIRQHLNLNMSRVLNVTFDVNAAVLKSRCCFSGRGLKCLAEIAFRVNDSHATSTTAG
jgi:hypothetical protein